MTNQSEEKATTDLIERVMWSAESWRRTDALEARDPETEASFLDEIGTMLGDRLTALQSAEQERDAWKAHYDNATARTAKYARETEAAEAERDKLAAEVRRLLGVIRWNVERSDAGDVLVCLGEHDKHEGCQRERWVPIARAEAAEAKLSSLDRRDVVGLELGDLEWLRGALEPLRLVGIRRQPSPDAPRIDRVLAALAPLRGEERS